MFPVYLSPAFSKAGYHFKGKIVKPGEKVFLGVHTPRQLKFKLPPPGLWLLSRH